MSFGLKRQDVAALLVVADPQPTMSHGLNTDHINLKWILRRRTKANDIEGENSVPRKQDPLGTLSKPRERTVHQSPHRVVVSPTASSLAALPGGEIQVSTHHNNNNGNGNDHHTNNTNDMSPQSSFSLEQDSASHHDESHSRFRGGDGTRNLLTLDQSTVCSMDSKHTVLLDSPRSVFIVLSNGHSVARICKADQQEFYNEALRTGVPLDMVNLRIAAENKRRLQCYHSLRAAYVELCSKLSSEALADAIRDQKYGIEIEAAKNRQRMKNVPRYAYYGGEDLGLFDEDCYRLLEHARNKTVDEVRNVLEQNEKKIQQQNERERNADQDMSALDAERRALEMKEKDQRERSRAIQRRADEFRQRVQRIRQEQEDEMEGLRKRVEVKQQEQEEFIEQQEMLRRHLSMSSFEAQQQKRVQVRQSVAAKDEKRRQDLIRRSEYLTQLHQREQDRRKEQLSEEHRLSKEALNERGRVTRLLAAVQLEEKRMKSEFAIAQSNERAEQFKKTRAMRFEARKQLVEERKERGAQARQLAEEKRARKALELEMDYERKQQYIADMNEEHEREMTLQKELNKQSRMIQKDEQTRCKQVNAFQSVGYLADAQAKADWLERENEKRRLLALQVRQERDALYRARDMILQQVEESEVQRKKQETFVKANSSNISSMLQHTISSSHNVSAQSNASATVSPSRTARLDKKLPSSESVPTTKSSKAAVTAGDIVSKRSQLRSYSRSDPNDAPPITFTGVEDHSVAEKQQTEQTQSAPSHPTTIAVIAPPTESDVATTASQLNATSADAPLLEGEPQPPTAAKEGGSNSETFESHEQL